MRDKIKWLADNKESCIIGARTTR